MALHLALLMHDSLVRKNQRMSTMSIFGTFWRVAAFALAIAAPAMAQVPSHEGDYYAPSLTTAQQPNAAQIQQDKEGDFYAATKTVIQRPDAAQIQRDKRGDYYAPSSR